MTEVRARMTEFDKSRFYLTPTATFIKGIKHGTDFRKHLCMLINESIHSIISLLNVNSRPITCRMHSQGVILYTAYLSSSNMLEAKSPNRSTMENFSLNDYIFTSHTLCRMNVMIYYSQLL